MKNALFIFGLLVSLWTHGQIIIYEDGYTIKDCQPHLLVSYAYSVEVQKDTGRITAMIKVCEDTGIPFYQELICTYKHFDIQLDSGTHYLVFTYEAPISCYVQYVTGLCDICFRDGNPDLVCIAACAGGCCSYEYLKYFQPYDGDMCEIYDTIFVYDTIYVMDTIPLVDTTWITDTIWINDTLEIIDTVPVYLVYESTTGVNQEKFEIRVTDNEIRLNFSPAEVRIYDLTGILLKTSSESIIDLAGIDTGIYILKIKLQNGEGFETKFLH
jgi:hypothetical protein